MPCRLDQTPLPALIVDRHAIDLSDYRAGTRTQSSGRALQRRPRRSSVRGTVQTDAEIRQIPTQVGSISWVSKSCQPQSVDRADVGLVGVRDQGFNCADAVLGSQAERCHDAVPNFPLVYSAGTPPN